MKTFKPSKSLLVCALGVAAAMGSQAFAAPTFSVDPDMAPGGKAPFTADLMNGISSELLHGNATTGTLTATSGWLQFTGFSNNGNAVLPGISRLGVDYQLYATFDLTATLVSGAFGAANSVYGLTSLNFNLWYDPSLDTSFTQANASTATEATVANAGDDKNLGGGSLMSGVAGFDNLFGAYLNGYTSYANTADGDKYFVAPVPFYNVSFNAFNNTTQGVNKVGTCSPLCDISITQAAGVVDFNKVPEPATLALMGLGLVGFAASVRKRKA